MDGQQCAKSRATFLFFTMRQEYLAVFVSRIHQPFVLRPSCFLENAGFNKKGANYILIRSNKMQQMQVFITANLLCMFRVSIDTIIRSTSNCNYSFWYRSYHVSGQRPSASVDLLGLIRTNKARMAEGRCPDT